MKIATWNVGEDETNENGKLNLDSYNYIIDFIKKRKYRCYLLTRSYYKI